MEGNIITEIPVDIKNLLDSEVERINKPSFIESDPVQFPRKFNKIQDIEIASFLSAIIAWGNRKMICRDINRMLEFMDYQPSSYVLDKEYENLNPEKNIHRTFFAKHLQYFLRGLRKIYKTYDSIDNFSHSLEVGSDNAPAWKLVSEMQKIMRDENNGETCSQCLPVNLKNTALKRINMALRWLVRDDGIVDMGVWSSIPKKSLYIPLDVHVGNVSRQLGLLNRKSNDRKSVEELTELMRSLRPDDPSIYDFALFGIGIESKNINKN